jgi:Flp pilus assembly protein TadB
MFAPTRHLFPLPAFDVETEAPCGTSVAEAREALAYWRGRLKRLPWYRRAARAEAREMVARWQRRMVQAELERWQLRALARPLFALSDWWGPTRGVTARRTMTRAMRASPLARIAALAAAAVAVAAVAMLALVVIAIALVLAVVLGAWALATRAARARRERGYRPTGRRRGANVRGHSEPPVRRVAAAARRVGL